ncbi:MAG: hypothetical protein CM15mP46_3270 [Alphaproteobacteria bacterium]|nr:MAG: hypothetical protein CM15mP46_3270 [Alphaproteobacteria bacterium]
MPCVARNFPFVGAPKGLLRGFDHFWRETMQTLEKEGGLQICGPNFKTFWGPLLQSGKKSGKEPGESRSIAKPEGKLRV